MTRIRRLIGDSRGAATIARFRKEADGIALVYFLVAMPVFVGLALLAIDTSRGNNLHYDIQKGVDALAIAAAAELDGGPNSITRARAAMRGMLQNGVRFNDGPDGIFHEEGNCPADAACVRVDFLFDLPPSDDTPIDPATYPAGHVTEDPAIASFAWVRARNIPGGNDLRQRMTTIFPVSILSGEGPATVAFGAEAVAGGTGGASGEICGLAPVYICNPFEGVSADEPLAEDLYSLHDLADPTNPNWGRYVTFREPGGTGAHAGGPGNYGYIGCEGAECVRHALAADDSGICTTNGETFTQPGFDNNSAWGANVRFDIYSGDLADSRFGDNEPSYPPSSNVRKGYVESGGGDDGGGDTGGGGGGGGPPDGGGGGPPGGGNDGSANSACGQAIGAEGEVMGLEPDFNVSDIDMEGSSLGDGQWDFESYWAINFGHENAKGEGMGGYTVDEFEDSKDWSNENPPSRYDMYRFEIDNDLVGVPSIGGETGNPSCYEQQNGDPPTADEPDRRLIKVAIVNCGEEEIRGRSTISVAFYAELFLTQPVGHTGTTERTFEGEIVAVSGEDGGGNFGGEGGIRPEVVLYR